MMCHKIAKVYTYNFFGGQRKADQTIEDICGKVHNNTLVNINSNRQVLIIESIVCYIRLNTSSNPYKKYLTRERDSHTKRRQRK